MREFGCAVSGNRLGSVAVVELSFMEDMTQRVYVAGCVAMRGESEIVSPVALGCRADHVVDDRRRVVRTRLGG